MSKEHTITYRTVGKSRFLNGKEYHHEIIASFLSNCDEARLFDIKCTMQEVMENAAREYLMQLDDVSEAVVVPF